MDPTKPAYLITKRMLLRLENLSQGQQLAIGSLQKEVPLLVGHLQALVEKLTTTQLYLVKNMYMARERLPNALRGLEEETSHYENVVYCCGLLKGVLSDLELIKERGYLSSAGGETGDTFERAPTVTLMKRTLSKADDAIEITADDNSTPLPSEIGNARMEMMQLPSTDIGISDFGNIFAESFQTNIVNNKCDLETKSCDDSIQKDFIHLILSYKGINKKLKTDRNELKCIADLKPMFAREFNLSEGSPLNEFYISHSVSGHLYQLENIEDLSNGCLISVGNPLAGLWNLSKNSLAYYDIETKLKKLEEEKVELKRMKQQLGVLIAHSNQMFEFVEKKLSNKRTIENLIHGIDSDDSYFKHNFELVERRSTLFIHFLERIRKDLTRGYPKPQPFISNLIHQTKEAQHRSITKLKALISKHRTTHKECWQKLLNNLLEDQERVKNHHEHFNVIVDRQKMIDELIDGIVPILDLSPLNTTPAFEPKVWNSEEIKSFGKKNVVLEIQLSAKQRDTEIETMVEAMKSFKVSDEDEFKTELRNAVKQLNPDFTTIERRRAEKTAELIRSILQK